MTEVGGWVLAENLEQWLEYLSSYVGYEFDSLDWAAISDALRETDADDEMTQYEYPIVGDPPLVVGLASAAEDGIVIVIVIVKGQIDPVLAARIETLFDLL